MPKLSDRDLRRMVFRSFVLGLFEDEEDAMLSRFRRCRKGGR